ncbi:hypothetical protein, partial [Parabacteroides sp.]|uniref:hypothetical protein n=1 Tax=Parabacteroides sp. TaxID=1869337 RepID=UPI0026DFD4BF
MKSDELLKVTINQSYTLRGIAIVMVLLYQYVKQASILFAVSYMVFLLVGKVNTVPLLMNFIILFFLFAISFMVFKDVKSRFLIYWEKNRVHYYLMYFFILMVIKDQISTHSYII